MSASASEKGPADLFGEFVAALLGDKTDRYIGKLQIAFAERCCEADEQVLKLRVALAKDARAILTKAAKEKRRFLKLEDECKWEIIHAELNRLEKIQRRLRAVTHGTPR